MVYDQSVKVFDFSRTHFSAIFIDESKVADIQMSMKDGC